MRHGISAPKVKTEKKYRCPGCGGRVAFPCYACAIRAGKRSDKIAGKDRPQYAKPFDTALAMVLPPRIANELELQGWLYVGDLLLDKTVTRERLLAIPGIGDMCVRKIVAAMNGVLLGG